MRIYKAILKPVWTYGIMLWGTSTKSNIDILERYQSKTLRLITSAPWFVSNNCIRRYLNVLSVRDEIKSFSEMYFQSLRDHIYPLAAALLDDSNETRRLKTAHIFDLHFRS